MIESDAAAPNGGASTLMQRFSIHRSSVFSPMVATPPLDHDTATTPVKRRTRATGSIASSTKRRVSLMRRRVSLTRPSPASIAASPAENNDDVSII